MSAPLTATGPLLRFTARRDRIKLGIWVGALFIFVPYMMTAYQTIFATPEDLAPLAAMLANPSLTLFTGPGYGLRDIDPATLEHQVIFASVYWLYMLIMVGLMNVMLVSRHTRLEEQTGRAELVRAAPVGRMAPLASTLILALIANLLVGGLTAGSLIAYGSDATSSLLIGTATAGFGLLFAGVTTVTSQFTAFSSGGSGMAGAVLAAAFVVRGVGDMAAGPDAYGTWISWLSPFAWAQQTAPFVLDRWWPAALLYAGAAVFIGIGVVLASRRDLGSGLVQPRRGRSTAPAWLRSPLTLAWRIQRTQTTWWLVGLALAGLMYGSFTPAMVEGVDALPDLFNQLMGGVEGALDGYLTLTVTMMRVTVAIYVVIAWQRVASEETDGRAEPVLATDVRPWAWLAGHAVVIGVASILMLLVTGTIAGVFGGMIDGEWGLVPDTIVASLAGIPAVLVVLGLAMALHSLAPRLVGIAWIPVIAGGLIEVFGDLMQLPNWARQISPFEHTPSMPAEEFTLAPFLVQAAVAAALAAVALWRIGRRDIPGH